MGHSHGHEVRAREACLRGLPGGGGEAGVDVEDVVHEGGGVARRVETRVDRERHPEVVCGDLGGVVLHVCDGPLREALLSADLVSCELVLQHVGRYLRRHLRHGAERIHLPKHREPEVDASIPLLAVEIELQAHALDRSGGAGVEMHQLPPEMDGLGVGLEVSELPSKEGGVLGLENVLVVVEELAGQRVSEHAQPLEHLLPLAGAAPGAARVRELDEEELGLGRVHGVLDAVILLELHLRELEAGHVIQEEREVPGAVQDEVVLDPPGRVCKIALPRLMGHYHKLFGGVLVHGKVGHHGPRALQRHAAALPHLLQAAAPRRLPRRGLGSLLGFVGGEPPLALVARA
mmetsp:Transcript_69281/g.219242  ORF Transcript_69281/g.219242 Transcript_69281/m.219242 type:complete len:347 (+) Transcript_69281:256-1296(+)